MHVLLTLSSRPLAVPWPNVSIVQSQAVSPVKTEDDAELVYEAIDPPCEPTDRELAHGEAMPPALAPQEFVARRRNVATTGRQRRI